MRRFLRVLLAMVLAILVLGAGGVGYRAWRQHENAVTLAIHTPNGIEESRFVRLGGIDQWVQIRGEDRNNPVILFVHGGPGSSETPLSALFRPWEKYFTVVMWDQRCAGKTFARNAAASCAGMNIASVAREGEALADWLRNHLHQKKIILLGHSWGTMVGVRMVKDRPDLFSAYVGTGQVVSIAQKEPEIYARAMTRLRAAHAEDGIAALRKIGAPPYRTVDDLLVERNWSERYDIPSERDLFSNLTPVVLYAPGWSPWDLYEFLQAPEYANDATYDADQTYDARALGMNYAVPFFVINGALDNVTPTDLAKPYFDTIQAPRKGFAVIPGAGHSAVLTKPDVFLQELVARVRPIAIANGASHG
jgi:pimeloyl-ACP methyl ester carboxylesterase